MDIRDALLQNLSEQELIASATLEGFKKAGFLFDHAIRCTMPPVYIRHERETAMRYKAKLVQNPEHLRETLDRARIVWVMGHLACNAVANLTDAFLQKPRKISKPPYPKPDPTPDSRFFVSEYLTWRRKS